VGEPYPPSQWEKKKVLGDRRKKREKRKKKKKKKGATVAYSPPSRTGVKGEKKDEKNSRA